jgi:septal ring factor EnvC (AmiA/AmiB activator)
VEYRQRNAPVSTTPVNPDKTDKKAQRQAAAALRQQLAPHKREADKLEAELGKVHEKLAKIDASLGDSDIYEPARKDELRDLLAEQAKLKVREASWKRPGWKRWNCWKACRRSWRRCPDGRLQAAVASGVDRADLARRADPADPAGRLPRPALRCQGPDPPG